MSIPNRAGRIVRLLDQGMLCAAEGQNVAALVRIIALQRSQYNIPACAKQWHLETTREQQQQKRIINQFYCLIQRTTQQWITTSRKEL